MRRSEICPKFGERHGNSKSKRNQKPRAQHCCSWKRFDSKCPRATDSHPREPWRNSVRGSACYGVSQSRSISRDETYLHGCPSLRSSWKRSRRSVKRIDDLKRPTRHSCVSPQVAILAFSEHTHRLFASTRRLRPSVHFLLYPTSDFLVDPSIPSGIQAGRRARGVEAVHSDQSICRSGLLGI